MTRNEFLRSLGDVREPDDPLQRIRELQQQILDAMEDTRCIGAATCPFFHSPSEQLYPGAVKAPWDES